MRHFIIFKRALVVSLEPGSSRPQVAKFGIRGQQQSPQDRPRGAVALVSVVAGNVVQITEEKAAKVCIKARISADTGRTDEAEAREHKQPFGQCIVAVLSLLHALLFPQGSSSGSFDGGL